jgi:hypothetical protein
MKTLIALFSITFFISTGVKSQGYEVLEYFPEVLDGTVHVVKTDTIENRVYIGGDFSALLYSNNPDDTISVQNFAVLNLSTGELIDLPIAPPDSTVFDILPDGDNLYIAGRFRNIGGQPREALARLDREGLTLQDWASGLELPNPNFRTIRDISRRGNRLYYAGQIAYVGDRFSGFGCVNTNTGNLVNWPAPNTYSNLNGSFRVIYPVDTTVFIGGNFSLQGPNGEGGNSTIFYDIMEIGRIGGISTDFNPSLTPSADDDIIFSVTDILRYEGTTTSLQGDLIISGNLYVEGGEMVGRIDMTTKELEPFGAQVYTTPNGTTAIGETRSTGQDLFLKDNTLFIASASYLAEFEITGGGSQSGSVTNVFSSDNWYYLSPELPPFGNPIWVPEYTARSVDFNDDILFAGGDFEDIGGETRRRFAAIQTNPTPCDVMAGVVSTESATQNICLNNDNPNLIQAVVTGNTGNSAYVLHDEELNIVAAKFNGLFNMDNFAPGSYYITHVGFTLIDNANITNLNDLEGCFQLSNSIEVTSFSAMPGVISTTDPLSYCADALPASISFQRTGSVGPNQGFVMLNSSNQIVQVNEDGVFDLPGLEADLYKVASVSTEETTVISEVTPSNLPDCFKYSNIITFNILECPDASFSSTPNPAIEMSNVSFTTTESENVQLELFDLTGKRIGLIYAGAAQAQTPMNFQFDTSALPQGVYIYKLTTESEVKTAKFLKN